MTQPFLGEIRIVAFNFPPKGWALCNGQTLPIAQNQALFSLLGTTYGGNGQTTFALPNLQSRHMVGFDPGSGQYQMGQQGGEEAVTLDPSSMPAHNHQVRAHAGSASDGAAPDAGSVWGISTTKLYATQIPAQPTTGATVGAMAPDALSSTGGSQPHENQPPLLVLNHVIALVGIFPSRN